MKLTKTTLALTLSSLFALPTFAEDKVENPEFIDFYGKLNIAIQSSDEKGETSNDLKSNASRVGVKGGYKLDHGLTAIYKLEWQVNVNDDSKDSLTARSQWVGIKGDFGQLTVGRDDTPLKVSQGKFDLFNDYAGDLKYLFVGENRVTDSITYKSPDFNNFRVLASYIIGTDENDDDPYSFGVQWGDGTLKKTKFFVSASHDSNMPGKKSIYDTTRLVGMYKMGDLRLGGILTTSEITKYDTDPSFVGESENGYAVNASYKLGKFLTKVQYQEFADADAINFGVDYKLGKNTKVFAWYTDREGLDFNGQTVKAAEKGTYMAIGMEQKF